ncbi:hypothetical protein K450DRAFT_269281 [Umbelopsis ramanniana AG]|uniref:Uncharacterized protein n=1 Tax=Umbelopsis ramanniana AG TaxID=1314678 RepID=A0AAD5EGL2_UMBRA|nr:uncharacterized protein K450DRAFT_269281 [Umbelopsis ramanniana AG]KAI8582536.1 hypothetical protein K450DRAFT_269281 [Umbelopsis ramanniana AG]
MRHFIERDILLKLHRNITVNQLINYDILRQQQQGLIYQYRKEQQSMERLKNIQVEIERLQQEYSKIQTDELHRAQKQATELQNTLSQLADEYSIAMDQIVDMALQKMTSVAEREEEITNHVIGEFEVYKSLVMGALEEAGSMHSDIHTVLDKLESHEVRLLEGLEDSVDKINTTMYQMTERFTTQLQGTCLYSNLLPFNWLKSIVYHIQHGFTLTMAKAVSVLLITITPLAVLLQGLRREFVCLALYMVTHFFQYPWVYTGVHPASSPSLYVRVKGWSYIHGRGAGVVMDYADADDFILG